MFKLGRGGGPGRGNGKRSNPPPPLPPPQNPHRTGGRLPVGPSASRNRTPGGVPGAGAASVPAREEIFSLESGGPLNFAAIIKLTPDLVEEIRRVEAQGGDVKIKFDPYSNHDSENVVDVGGKEFKFTWSKDTGDLCDIYEQRQNGENGNGLLVECGSSWRKLTVQRILDESTKNHVKMLSEEAERLSKSRKAIVLDPANPSVKSQAKSMVAAAVEGNMRRGWKHKKEFFKKRKVESDQVSTVFPTKSSLKSGTSSHNATKSQSPVSPLASPPELRVPATSVSPLGKGDLRHDDLVPNLNSSKDMPTNLEKGMHNRVKLGISGNEKLDGFRTADLQSILISLLSVNPRGMSLKELEKAAEESLPNSSKKIESIIRMIATYQAPRYFLKPEIEVENFKQALESGSSPDIDDHASVADIHLDETSNAKFGQQSLSTLKLEEAEQNEKNETIHNSEFHVSGELKINSESEDRAGSSSDSGSDSESDSESSDSESDSGSQSRSRSPAGSVSASSSDSESDGSSSNKEGSDVDVDIMTSDDEKDVLTNVPEAVENKLSQLNQRSKYETEDEGDDPGRKQEVHQLDLNDFKTCDGEKNVFEDPKGFARGTYSAVDNTEIRTSRAGGLEPLRTDSSDGRISVNDDIEPPQSSSFNNKQNKLKDGLGEEPDFNIRASKPKPKRAASSDYFPRKTEVTKRAKNGSSFFEDNRESASSEMHYSTNRLEQKWSNTISDINSQDYRPESHERVAASGESSRIQQSPDVRTDAGPNTEQSGQRNTDRNGKKEIPRNLEKSSRSIENFEGSNRHRTGALAHHDDFDASVNQNMGMDKYAISENGLQRNTRRGDTHESEKYFSEKLRDVSGDIVSTIPDTNCRESSESYGISNGQQSAGKRNVLTRELSDLELGEFREVADEKNGGNTRQAEKKGSSKSPENRVHLDLSTNKNKAARTATQQLRSPSSSRGTIAVSYDYRKTPLGRNHDSAQHAERQSRVMHSQNEQSSRMNHVDSHSMAYEKSVEVAASHEIWSRQEVSPENYVGVQKKIPAGMLRNHDFRFSGHMGHNNVKDHDNRSASQLGYNNAKESKGRKLNGPRDMADSSKNDALVASDTHEGKTRDSSSDDDNFFYLKYDKGEPDLKGSIKDFSQYKEYVQEYHEKYEAYCSLNKNLEKIRNDFLKIGNDLEQAKGRNMEDYYKIVIKLREMYHQFGEKNKQMKKVFLLLHDELKNLKQRIKDFADAYSNE